MARKKKVKSSESTESKTAFAKLPGKHKEFFLAYLKFSGNATKAYQSVYSNVTIESAAVRASATLRNVKIAAALREHYDNLWKNKEDMIGKTFENLLKMANADIHDVVEFDEDGEMKIKDFNKINTFIIKKIGQKKTINQFGENVQNTIEIVDKEKVSTDLLRVLGMIQEKLKVTFNYDKESAQAIKDIFNESLASEKTDK
jgi:hypothetical protein